MPLKSYRELEVWKIAMELVAEIYSITNELPSSEKFGIHSQARRASISIPCNIAEGYGRGSRKDYIRFLIIARGSLFELQTLIQLIAKLQLLSREKLLNSWHKSQSVGKILTRLIAKLSLNSISNPPENSTNQ